MRRFTLLILSTLILGTMISQTVIYQDNFDSYNLTQGITAQSTHWRTWSSQNGGGSNDAFMSTAKSVSGTKSLKIINTNDIVYNFGGQTAGNSTKIYKNTGTTFNTSPTTPTNLNTVFQGDRLVILSWNKSTDTQIPQNGLSYDIRIGSTTNDIDIVSPQSNVNAGYRRVI